MPSKKHSTTNVLSRKLPTEEDLKELEEEDNVESIINRDFFVGFYRNTSSVYVVNELESLDLLEGSISLESKNLVFIKLYLQRLSRVSRSEYRRLIKKSR